MFHIQVPLMSLTITCPLHSAETLVPTRKWDQIGTKLFQNRDLLGTMNKSNRDHLRDFRKVSI